MLVIKEKNRIKLYKVLRVVIILIFISLSYLLYSSEYNIKPETKDIESGIEEFIKEDIENFEAYGKKYSAILGTNYDLLIEKVKVEWEPGRVFNINLNDEEEVLEIFESKAEIQFREITLYDKHGEDITEKMRKYLTDKSSYGCGKGKAELFLLNIFCIALLAIGYFISRVFQKSI